MWQEGTIDQTPRESRNRVADRVRPTATLPGLDGFAPVIGAYLASAGLLAVAVNLVFAGYFDVAVRDAVMAIGALTLGGLLAASQRAAEHGAAAIVTGQANGAQEAF
jgi:hypothetical protein